MLLTSTKAAKYLGVSVDTLYEWTKAGSLTPILTPGGHRRYRTSDLDAFGGTILAANPEYDEDPGYFKETWDRLANAAGYQYCKDPLAKARRVLFEMWLGTLDDADHAFMSALVMKAPSLMYKHENTNKAKS